MNSLRPVASSPSAAAADRGLALAVEGVDLRFGGIHALRNVSFAARPGEITAVIGPNGAGKTSVFNTVSGFYRPANGRIRLGSADITKTPVHSRAARGLARTFQNIALFHGLTVLENIKLGGHHTMHAGVVSALLYGRATRREELRLREEVEHDMGMVMDISSHVVVLNFGEVIASGSPAEVRRHPQVIAAYLGADNGAAP